MLSRKILQTGLRRHIKLTTSVRGAVEWDDTEPQAHDAQHLQSPFHDGGARADYMTGSDARTVGYSDWETWYANFMAEQESRTQGFKDEKRGKQLVLGTGFAGGDVWTSSNVWEARHFAPKFANQMMEQYRVQRGEKLGTRLEQIGSNRHQTNFLMVGNFLLCLAALDIVAGDSDTGNGNPQF